MLPSSRRDHVWHVHHVTFLIWNIPGQGPGWRWEPRPAVTLCPNNEEEAERGRAGRERAGDDWECDWKINPQDLVTVIYPPGAGQGLPSFLLGTLLGDGGTSDMVLAESRAGSGNKAIVPFEHTEFEVPRTHPERAVQQLDTQVVSSGATSGNAWGRSKFHRLNPRRGSSECFPPSQERGAGTSGLVLQIVPTEGCRAVGVDSIQAHKIAIK